MGFPLALDVIVVSVARAIAARWRTVLALGVGAVAFAKTDHEASINDRAFRTRARRARRNFDKFRRARRLAGTTTETSDDADVTRSDDAQNDVKRASAGTRRVKTRGLRTNFVLGVAHAPRVDRNGRYEGKPLALIHGKPAFARLAETMKRCTRIERVVVATDDYRVAETAKEYGIETVLVAPEVARTSTVYAREAAKATGGGWDYVCVVDVEECLLDADSIDACVCEMETNVDEMCVMSSCVTAIDPAGRESGGEERNAECIRPRCVEDVNGFAMYISRAAIPVNGEARNGELVDVSTPTKRAIARDFQAWSWGIVEATCFDAVYLRMTGNEQKEDTPLSRIENIDALNALERGYKIKVCHVNHQVPPLRDPKDVSKLDELLRAKVDKLKRASMKSPTKKGSRNLSIKPNVGSASEAPSTSGSPAPLTDTP